jgi:hypothetical protein
MNSRINYRIKASYSRAGERKHLSRDDQADVGRRKCRYPMREWRSKRPGRRLGAPGIAEQGPVVEAADALEIGREPGGVGFSDGVLVGLRGVDAALSTSPAVHGNAFDRDGRAVG